MTKRIFRSILGVSLVVLLASLVLIVGVLHGYFQDRVSGELESLAEYIAHGVEENGTDYLTEDLPGSYRITWVDADGTVLFDNRQDPEEMENHAQREEIREALILGKGQAIRYSDTLSQQLSVSGQGILKKTEISVNMTVICTDRDRHGVALQANTVNGRVLFVVSLGIAIPLIPKVTNGTAGEDRQVQHPVERELLRLPGPLLSGAPPDLGRDVWSALAAPLGQTQGEALDVAVVGVPAVDTVVALGYDHRLVFEIGGDVHRDTSIQYFTGSLIQ